MSPEQVQAIRERLAKITPGPWRVAVTAEEAEWWWGDPTPQPEAVVIEPGAEVAVCATNDDGIATYQEIANAEFIAHAPTDLAALLADREQREREIERLREALRKLANEASEFLALAHLPPHGVMNLCVLQLRIDEARAALAPQAGSREEGSMGGEYPSAELRRNPKLPSWRICTGSAHKEER